jgi:hypothetical protein
MRPAPVRRIVALLGLVSLTPVALKLYSGELTPVEAAARALVVLAVVVLLTRVAGWGLRRMLVVFEKDQDERRGKDAALDQGGMP